MEDAFVVSRDPVWHRWIDGLVIMLIGFAAGMVMIQALKMDEMSSTNTLRQITSPQATEPGVGSGASTQIPSGFRVEEG